MLQNCFFLTSYHISDISDISDIDQIKVNFSLTKVNSILFITITFSANKTYTNYKNTLKHIKNNF